MISEQMNTFEQALLKYYSPEQLEKIQSAKIGIGGAGGLGSNAAITLVRSGVKYIEIIDHDTVEASNLNRQQYFLQDIGLKKIDVLKKTLLNINPDLTIYTYDKKWSEENAGLFLKGCDIVLECFDTAREKCAFVEHYKNMVNFIISGNGMAGLNMDIPIVRRKVGNVFFIGDGKTGTEQGYPPMAPRVCICASMMAGTAIDIILNNF